MLLECCVQISNTEVWILKDIKGFTSRKLVYAICPICKEAVVSLIEKRTSDGKLFINNNITGLEAVKTIYREKKRLLAKINKINTYDLFGWIYGSNKEIRTKNGKISQIRQYATDFSNKKQLVKKIMV